MEIDIKKREREEKEEASKKPKTEEEIKQMINEMDEDVRKVIKEEGKEEVIKNLYQSGATDIDYLAKISQKKIIEIEKILGKK